MQTRYRLSLGSVVLVLILGCGEQAKPKAPAKAPANPSVSAAQPAPPPAPPPSSSGSSSSGFVGNAPSSPAAHVVRGKEHTQIRNMLHQMGIMYKQYQAENGKAPTAQEMMAYAQRDMPQLVQAFKEGKLVMPARQGGGGGNYVVAHEKNLDLNQIREVLFADGSVQKMTDAQLKAALRN